MNYLLISLVKVKVVGLDDNILIDLINQKVKPYELIKSKREVDDNKISYIY